MNIGLITEYNPFHNGHLTHINSAKQIDNAKNIIVITSGNYVQRGEPAICDKYSRTKMALLNGADLVLELPIYYATSSAEYFAHGAVNILDKTNIVDVLFFGSEIGNVKEIEEVAQLLVSENKDYKTKLKKYLNEGNSFPYARAQAVMSVIDKNNNVLNSPNNILGVEYIKAIKNIGSNIKPMTLKRQISNYNSADLDNEISSATAIRIGISNKEIDKIKNVMPKNAFHILEKNISSNYINTLDHYTIFLHYILKTKSSKQLSQILDISEGLENRIINSASTNYMISDILDDIKTKRYTYTRLQRAILHIILQMKKEDFDNYYNNQVMYARVLGFRKEKAHLVSELNKKSSIPVIMNLKNAHEILDKTQMQMLKKEIQSTDLYYSAMMANNKNPVGINTEFKIPLVII